MDMCAGVELLLGCGYQLGETVKNITKNTPVCHITCCFRLNI